jgi:lipopolysaccharide export system protein LptA
MTRALFLASLLIAGSAVAAPAPGHHDASQPIAVSSDRFVVEKSPAASGSGTIAGTYVGNVIITQGDVRLRADTVRILLVEGHAQKVFANGHIVVDSPNTGTATGDAGVYDVVPRLVTLTGHVVLTKDKNVMRGAQLTVNLVSGVAQLGGGVTGTHGTSGGGRVQGLFTPPPQTGGK